MRRRHFVRSLSAAGLCAGALFTAVGSQAASASGSGRTVLGGTAAPAAALAHQAGAVNAASQVSFELVLKLRDESGAKALVQAISTPGSSSYRHYLTAAQWEARFSPTADQVAQATAWLQSQGFTVGAVSKDRLTIAASGTAAQVESAFDTSLGTYRVGAQTLRKATTDLSVPSSIGGIVEGALGINQSVARPASAAGNPDIPGSATGASSAASPGQFPPAPPAFLTHPPCGNYYGAQQTLVTPPFGQGYPRTVPDVVCGYIPPQFRSAYGVTRAATGRGATVAIIDAYDSATIASDATRYFSRHDPTNPFSNASFTQIDAPTFDQQAVCDASGWLTEQAIDVEAVHGTAPNASIVYVGAQNCFDSGLLTAEQTVIDNRLADVVTNSWGDPAGDLLTDPATKTAYDDEFLLADAIGMTIQFSSGDDGDNFDLVGFSAPSYPPSSPFVTGVGGTTLKIGPTGARAGELGWDTGRAFLCTANVVNLLCDPSQLGTWTPASADGASGGYTSYTYLQPFYQAGIVPTPLAERNAPIFGPVPLRVVPDISADADPGTGFLIGLHQTLPNGTSQYTETRYGGTSLASPLLAGLVADADQAAGVQVGFINPTIYRLSVNKPMSILDIRPEQSLQGNYRVDYAGALGLGLPTTGTATSFRELYYLGPEVYCDATGNCATRPETLTAAPGYDGLTGLGAPGAAFINALAGS